jgi:hypothetical protein
MHALEYVGIMRRATYCCAFRKPLAVQRELDVRLRAPKLPVLSPHVREDPLEVRNAHPKPRSPDTFEPIPYPSWSIWLCVFTAS